MLLNLDFPGSTPTVFCKGKPSLKFKQNPSQIWWKRNNFIISASMAAGHPGTALTVADLQNRKKRKIRRTHLLQKTSLRLRQVKCCCVWDKPPERWEPRAYLWEEKHPPLLLKASLSAAMWTHLRTRIPIQFRSRKVSLEPTRHPGCQVIFFFML